MVIRALRAGICALVVMAVLVPAARAVPYAVVSTADNPDANTSDNVCADSTGHCTLRAAIETANSHAGGDTVTLPAGLYKLSHQGGNPSVLNVTGDLILTGS